MRILLPMLIAIASTPLIAQSAPHPPQRFPNTTYVRVDKLVGEPVAVVQSPNKLLRDRKAYLRNYVDDNRAALTFDDNGAPAVRGQIIAVAPGPRAEAALVRAGFAVIARETIDPLGISFTRFSTPEGRRLKAALHDARRRAPGVAISADTIHFPAGTSIHAVNAPLAQGGVMPGAIGLIDGGVARHPSLTASVEQRGFVRGAPLASVHGTAVASLLAGNGTVRGGAPGAALRVADVYGRDPAGGGAVAISRALGWLASRDTRVVTISLAGPPNALLEAAVAAAQRRGMTIVASVGNDGRDAPTAFPAAYPGVVAVSGVDGRLRTMVESRVRQRIDFAAPGADILAADIGGDAVRVRGTSYATALVAGALTTAPSLPALARSAQKPSRWTGSGIVCVDCPAR